MVELAGAFMCADKTSLLGHCYKGNFLIFTEKFILTLELHFKLCDFIIMYQELYIPNNTNCPSIISFPSGIGLCNKGSPAPGSQNIMRDVVFMAGEQQVEDH